MWVKNKPEWIFVTGISGESLLIAVNKIVYVNSYNGETNIKVSDGRNTWTIKTKNSYEEIMGFIVLKN